MPERERFRLPYVNLFLYASGDVYSVDFYYNVEAADYPQVFAEGWTQLARRAQARARSTILFFTECPGCGLSILTNRDEGAPLRCKNCGTESACAPVTSARLVALVGDAHRAIGKELESIAGERLVLLLQVLDRDAEPDVAEICRTMGFTPLADSHPIAANLWFDGVRRRVLEPSFDHSVWETTAGPGSVAYVDETPPQIEAVLRAIGEVAACRSMSSRYDPADDTTAGLVVRGEHAALERQLREDLAANPRDAATLDLLIESLIAQEKLDDAQEKAIVATELRPDDASRWTTLGKIEWRLGRHRDAAAALERALSLDPVDRLALFLLAQTYVELGEGDKAEAAAHRLHALGGPV